MSIPAIIIFTFIFAFAKIALGVDTSVVPVPPEELPWWGDAITRTLGKFPEINLWLVAVFTAMSIVLRGLADLLLFISTKTETKTDDQWAIVIGRIASWSGRFLGWFGGGKPKALK